MSRDEWRVDELGRAMIEHYTSTWPKGWRVRADGVEGAAHFRDGDNESAFRIIEARGVAMDARRGRSYSAKQYAEEIAGCSLVDLMARFGRASSTPTAAKPQREQPTARNIAPEARALWASAIAVDEDGEASAWLRSRGLDVGRVVDADVARAIPVGAHLPSWAKCKGVSWDRAYRLVTPLRNERGEIVNLHARRIVGNDELPKTASAAGVTTRGQVLANNLGRGLLVGYDGARKLVEAITAETSRPAVVVVEGLPSFLAWAIDASDADVHAPAVLGILAGSWCGELAARIPDGTRVLVDVDSDEAGAHYLEQIVSTLQERDVEVAQMKRAA
jgi:hypothetical protein